MPNSEGFPTGPLLKRLKKVSILGAFSPHQLKSLAKGVEVVSFGTGETVVRRGEKGNGLYLILEGSAAVKRGRRVLARLGAGQFFGELSLFDNEPRSADVVTLRPSKLAILSTAEFWGYVASQPEILLRILEEMSRRLRATSQALAE